ncbi:unnamed protein product [Sphenostylis stenocarpa]|uniref:Uncharacterized protein n=1 Tax=Sphenostylis stenocarpa TaxID=92480 RepID=A0AA86TCF4_9FABA|nr:unnamed protein product [Sphenostylis stenocarpa]
MASWPILSSAYYLIKDILGYILARGEAQISQVKLSPAVINSLMLFWKDHKFSMTMEQNPQCWALPDVNYDTCDTPS